MSQSATRYPWEKIDALIARIESEIGGQLDTLCTRREWAGSYRRRRPTCGDLDLVLEPSPGVTSDQFSPVMLTLCDEVILPSDGQTLKRGKLRRSGIALDLCIARPPSSDLLQTVPSSFGICLLTRTGPLGFNTRLARLAGDQGLRYSPFCGLIRQADGACVASASEADVLEALGLPWISPDQRDAHA